MFEFLSTAIYKKIEIAKYLRILSPLIIIMYLDIVIDGILKGLDAQVSVMAINVIDCIISIGFIYFLFHYLDLVDILFLFLLVKLLILLLVDLNYYIY